MSWEAVARKDFRDAVRSYWLWGLSAIFVVFFTVPAFFFADQLGGAARDQGAELSSDAFLPILAEVNAFFVPVIAIVIAYAAIAGERDSGTLKLLLSLPHSRLDVVAGKVVGRGAVVVLPVLLGFAVAAVVFLATPVTFGARSYVLFALLTALLALVFVAIAVGFSAAAETGRRAMISTVGVYVLFTLFWSRFADGLIGLVTDHVDLEGATTVELHLLVKVLNPTTAYRSLTHAIDTPGEVAMGNTTIAHASAARSQLAGGAGLQGQFRRQLYAQTLGSDPSFFLTDPFLVLLLLVWLVGVPLAGYYAFREADL